MRKLLLLVVVWFVAQSAHAVVIICGSPVSLPVLQDAHIGTSVEEELLKPPPTVVPVKSAAWSVANDGKLIRLPGPKIKWPHQGCLMCLGIHLERTHKVPMKHLQTFGSVQWDVIHCNLHNEKLPPEATPPPPKPQSKAGGCSGGNCSSPSAIRWRGLFR